MKKNLFLCLFALLGFLSAAAQTTGNKGFKLNVNSGDAYLDCGDITQLNKAGAYTIESWVNITLDDLDDRFIIFKKEQPDERNRIKVQVEKSGQIYVMQANGADGAYAQTSAGCYPKSGWHHIALVYDGTKTSTDEGVIILYIDGIRQAFSNAFFKPTTGDIDASFVLGGASLACYDEVRIWNKALDLETISKWKSYKVLDSHPEKANLVAYYDFQNVSETTVPDLQGAYPATFKTTEAEIKDIDLKIFEEVGEMTIESAMVSQKTGNAYAKEENIELLTLKINTVGAGELSLSGLDISLDGTTKLTDIASINVYYAGDKAQITDESFTMNYQALRPGNGKLELRDEVNAGKQALLVGNNFFIVAIRLKPTATDGGKLDGQITKLYFSNGNSITPENPNPNGDMTIRQINELDEAAYTQKCKDYNNKIVFGWFPWFSVTTIDKVDWKGLTHVAPIGFEIDKGNYTPTFEDKGIDLKWPWIDFINDAHKNGVKVLAAITGNVRDGGNTAFYVDLFGDSQKMRTAAAAIAKIMGGEASAVEKKAVVQCQGSSEHCKPAYDYKGIQTCAAAAALYGGPKTCSFACIGLGDCTKVCKFDAIHIVDGVAKVNKDKCTGCGACANICPKQVIMIDAGGPRKPVVMCSNKDKGAVANKLCTTSCIACGMCERTCKFDAIHVVDGVARVDYDKCKGCGMCAQKCPKKIILFPLKDDPYPPKPVVKPAAPAAKPAAPAAASAAAPEAKAEAKPETKAE